jgi:opacity protein-like surface antigen
MYVNAILNGLLENIMQQIRTFILMSFAIAASALPVQTFAASPDSTRFYVGAQLGDSVVGGLLGLQINKTYSMEVRYDYIDTVDQPNTTVDASTVGITGMGMYPVRFGKARPFAVFMKAGYELTTTETTTNDPGIAGVFPPTTTVTTKEEKRVVVGAGVQFDFSQNVSGRIGLNAVGSDHTAYLTAIYKF